MEAVIVTCLGDFGLPNPKMAKILKPVDYEACRLPGESHWGLIKGQKYEYSGDITRFDEIYPKDWHEKSLAGKPSGLALLFEYEQKKTKKKVVD